MTSLLILLLVPALAGKPTFEERAATHLENLGFEAIALESVDGDPQLFRYAATRDGLRCRGGVEVPKKKRRAPQGAGYCEEPAPPDESTPAEE